MFKRTLWITVLVISIVSTIIFFTGLVCSITISSGTKAAVSNKNTVTIPNPPRVVKVNSNTYNILVLGDSLAKGTGDEKGKGFPNYFADSLKTKIKKDIKVNNLAVNGDKSIGLLKIVESKDTLPSIESAKIVFISIGGNEITQFKNPEIASVSTELKPVQDNYLQNLRNILKFIRNNNSSCSIIVIGLYNPFGKDITPDKIKFLNDWNYETQQVLADDTNSTFIPTYDLFKNNLSKYLTIDNFHPNSAGYQAISKRILEGF